MFYSFFSITIAIEVALQVLALDVLAVQEGIFNGCLGLHITFSVKKEYNFPLSKHYDKSDIL